MTKFLCQSHTKASDALSHSKHYFQELSQAASLEAVQHWTHEIEQAEWNQLSNPNAMDIYGSQLPIEMSPNSNCTLAPTRAQTSNMWLDFALMIEEKQ